MQNRNKFLYNDDSAGIDKILFQAPGNFAMPKFYTQDSILKEKKKSLRKVF